MAKVEDEAGEPLESLDVQPRGSQTETSAVAVASIVPSLMICLVIQGLHLQPNLVSCEKRVKHLAVAANVALLSFSPCCVLRWPLCSAVQLVYRVVLLHCIARPL
jgi:hypothetical protein